MFYLIIISPEQKTIERMQKLCLVIGLALKYEWVFSMIYVFTVVD